MKPLKKNVLVAQLKGEKETEGGIVLMNAEITKNAKVLAVGNEVTLVEVGETVIPDWSKSKATAVEGVQCAVIDEGDIMAVLDDE